MRILLGWLALVPLLAVLGGCTTTETNTRPPKQPMVYRPPPDEPAYSKPLEYPKETMEQDPTIKKAKGSSVPGMSGRPGSGPGSRIGTGF